MMKKTAGMLLLMATVFGPAKAQDAIALSHYIFNEFRRGHVLQKNGSNDAALLNYNVLSGEMIFEPEPGKFLALAVPEAVDTVFIEDRKFVPVNGKFYELLTATAYPLFVEYTCTVKEPGNDVGYGMQSVTTASPAVKALIQSGGAYNLHLPDGFTVVPGYMYWLYRDGHYLKVNNARQLMAAIPEKKDKINNVLKTNNTDFKKGDQIAAVVRQL